MFSVFKTPTVTNYCCFWVFFCKVFQIPVQGMQLYCYCFLKIVSQCCEAALSPNLEMQRNWTGLCCSGVINVTGPIVWCQVVLSAERPPGLLSTWLATAAWCPTPLKSWWEHLCFHRIAGFSVNAAWKWTFKWHFRYTPKKNEKHEQ